jgi:hypothetical protein
MVMTATVLGNRGTRSNTNLYPDRPRRHQLKALFVTKKVPRDNYVWWSEVSTSRANT